MKLRRTAFEVFTDYFEKALRTEATHTAAYSLAEKQFEDDKGFAVYSSYHSYRQIRERKFRRLRP